MTATNYNSNPAGNPRILKSSQPGVALPGKPVTKKQRADFTEGDSERDLEKAKRRKPRSA